MKKFVVACLIALFAAAYWGTFASAADTKGAEKAVSSAFSALQKKDWKTACKYVPADSQDGCVENFKASGVAVKGYSIACSRVENQPSLSDSPVVVVYMNLKLSTGPVKAKYALQEQKGSYRILAGARADSWPCRSVKR